jgi:hypothetical protein
MLETTKSRVLLLDNEFFKQELNVHDPTAILPFTSPPAGQ